MTAASVTLAVDVSLQLEQPIDAMTWKGEPCKVEVINGTVYNGDRKPYYRQTKGRKVKKDGSLYADATNLPFNWEPPEWVQQAIRDAALDAARRFCEATS